MKRTQLTVSATVAGITTWGLLMTSPVCGCLPAEYSFARELGFEPVAFRETSEVVAGVISEAVRKKYAGQRLESIQPPRSGREGDCTRVEDARLHCVYWFEGGLLRRTGASVDFVADGRSGVLSRVDVSSLSRWKF